MNIAYLVYQAERQPSAAEQRAADIRRGELASALGRLVRRRPAWPQGARDVPARGGARRPAAVQDMACTGQRSSAELAGC